MTEFVDFLWRLLENILTAVLPILATALTAWLVQKIREIGKKMDSNTMAAIQMACEIAVNAAEQAGLAGLVTNKKAYAINLAQEYLTKQNIKVDVALLAGIIESAVMTEITRNEVFTFEDIDEE